MNFLLNLLWLVFGGGFLGGLLWGAVGILFTLSVVGIPWARAAFNIAAFTFWPFGQTAVAREELTHRSDLGSGVLGDLGNVLWVVFAGWWLALGHLVAALTLTVTIIGIPFAWQHLKLAGLALWPIGMAVVPNGIADRARWVRS